MAENNVGITKNLKLQQQNLTLRNGRTEPVPSWSCSRAVSKPVWHIPLLHVKWKTPDDGQRNCPKHVDFYSKNKFEKLVHLVGFIIRIYHDARSPERQRRFISLITECKVATFSTTTKKTLQQKYINLNNRRELPLVLLLLFIPVS